jgi:peptide/nickel transport system substrate-binding protein
MLLAGVALAPGIAAAKTVTIAIGAEPSSLDAQAVDDGAERYVNNSSVFESLLTRDAKGNLQPQLAAEMPVQTAPTTWTFKLRQGVTFHNGEPFNAGAVEHSVKRILSEELNSQVKSWIHTITGAKAIDDTTVEIYTSLPDPILPARMPLFTIVPIEASQSDDFSAHPVGTGPYKFDSWSRGDSITLVAYDGYWGEKPAIDEVVYRFIADPGTRLSALLAGEVDVITNVLPEVMDQLPKAVVGPSTEHIVLPLDTAEGITSDVRVRRALNLAIDKDAINDQLFGGLTQTDAGQMLAPADFGFDPETKAFPYDPDAARALIEEAGATGKTITLVGEAGRWLKDRELVEAVGGFWSEIGLVPDLQILEWSDYLATVYDRSKRPDAYYIVGSNELFDADRPFRQFYSPEGNLSSNNIEELAPIVEAAGMESDTAKRLELYQQASRIAHEQAILVWLNTLPVIYGVSERLEWTPRADAQIFAREMDIKE